MASAKALKIVRLIHLYTGLFFAPAILFFAITGGLQMFGLHETSRGSSYVPPALLVHLAQLHKKGTLYVAPRKAAPKPDASQSDAAKSDAAKADASKADAPKLPPPSPATPPPNPLPMKIFFAATALALAISTFTGIVMAWRFARRKSVAAFILVAGAVVPVLLLLI